MKTYFSYLPWHYFRSAKRLSSFDWPQLDLQGDLGRFEPKWERVYVYRNRPIVHSEWASLNEFPSMHEHLERGPLDLDEASRAFEKTSQRHFDLPFLVNEAEWKTDDETNFAEFNAKIDSLYKKLRASISADAISPTQAVNVQSKRALGFAFFLTSCSMGIDEAEMFQEEIRDRYTKNWLRDFGPRGAVIVLVCQCLRAVIGNWLNGALSVLEKVRKVVW